MKFIDQRSIYKIQLTVMVDNFYNVKIAPWSCQRTKAFRINNFIQYFFLVSVNQRVIYNKMEIYINFQRGNKQISRVDVWCNIKIINTAKQGNSGRVQVIVFKIAVHHSIFGIFVKFTVCGCGKILKIWRL